MDNASFSSYDSSAYLEDGGGMNAGPSNCERLKSIFNTASKVQFVQGAPSAPTRNIFVVGLATAVKQEAKTLANLLGSPIVAKIAEQVEKPEFGGSLVQTEVLPTPDASKTIKVSMLLLPEDAGRHTTKSRPDLVSKKMMGKLAKHDVWVVGEHTDLHPLSMAVARCVPSFSLKEANRKIISDASENQTDPKVQDSTSVYLVPTDGKDASELAAPFENMANAIQMAQFLVDAPPNFLTTSAFHELAQDIVGCLDDVSYTSMQGEMLKMCGYNGIYSVGKGAANEPILLVFEYNPEVQDGGPPVALVGKGITFDTGGISIKPSDAMCKMKTDMGGAAGMFGAFVAAVRAKVRRKIVCVLCLAENSVAGNCYTVDDVLEMYSGLTVEVKNTDAEGRLCLADGAAHVAKHCGDVEKVIVMATLTGAQGITASTTHAMVMSNSEAFEQELLQHAKRSGDQAMAGLFAPECLMQEYDSTVADMTNLQKTKANGNSHLAGLFVWKHLTHAGFSGDWAHFDIAFPSYDWGSERGTGYGVSVLSRYLGVPMP